MRHMCTASFNSRSLVYGCNTLTNESTRVRRTCARRNGLKALAHVHACMRACVRVCLCSRSRAPCRDRSGTSSQLSSTSGYIEQLYRTSRGRVLRRCCFITGIVRGNARSLSSALLHCTFVQQLCITWDRQFVISFKQGRRSNRVGSLRYPLCMRDVSPRHLRSRRCYQMWILGPY